MRISDWSSDVCSSDLKAMCTHPNVVKTLPLDCTVSIGKTFRPYNGTAFSQFELDECSSEIDGIVPKELLGKKLPDDIVARVVNFIADAKEPANDTEDRKSTRLNSSH